MLTPSIVGSITEINTSNNSGSQSVTVPTGANFAVVLASFWNSGPSTFTTLTLNGISFDHVITSQDASYEATTILKLNGPTSGTFSWAITNTDGMHIYLVFLKDVDLSAPVLGSNYGQANSDNNFTLNTSSFTSADGAFILGVGSGYFATAADAGIGTQTELVDSGIQGSCWGVLGSKVSGASSDTFGVAWNVTPTFWGTVSALSIQGVFEGDSITGQLPSSAETAAESPWSDDDWNNPANIYGAGVADIVAPTFDNNDQTYVIKAYNFTGLSAIPSGATIVGITVRVNARFAAGGASIDLMQLLDTSKAKVGTNLAATPVSISGTLTDYSFGGNSDLWGNALTDTWVKNSNFGVAIGMIATSNNTDVEIDYVQMDVYYIAAGNVDVDVDTLSFSSTLNAVTILRNQLVNVSTLGYTRILNDVQVAYNYVLDLDSISYLSTFYDVEILVNKAVSIETASYLSTLYDIEILQSRIVLLDTLEFNRILFDVDILRHTLVSADTLSYSITLYDVELLIIKYIDTDLLSFSTTLYDVTVIHNRVVNVDTLAFSSSFNDVVVLRNRLIVADILSFNSTYNDVLILYNYLVEVDTQTYTRNLLDVLLLQDQIVNLDVLSFTETLNPVDIITATGINLDLLSFISDFYDVTLLHDLIVYVDNLQFTSTLYDVDILLGKIISVDTVSYTRVFYDVTITVETIIPVDLMTFTFTFYDVTVSMTSRIVNVDTLEFNSILNDVSILSGTNILVDSLAYTEILYDVSILYNYLVPVDTSVYNIAYYDVDIIQYQVIFVDSLVFITTFNDVDVIFNPLVLPATPLERIYSIRKLLTKYPIESMDTVYEVGSINNIYSVKKE